MSLERDIERVLREAAEQRRKQAGAPFELHPADRRALQAEIARRRPSRSQVPWNQRWLPRLAWGFGLAVVVALGAFILSPPLSRQSADKMALATKPDATVELAKRQAVEDLDRKQVRRDATLALEVSTAVVADAVVPAAPPASSLPAPGAASGEASSVLAGRAFKDEAAQVQLRSSPVVAAAAPTPTEAPTSFGVGGSGARREVKGVREEFATNSPSLAFGSDDYAASAAPAVAALSRGVVQDYQGKLKAAGLVQNYSRALPLVTKTLASPARRAGTSGAIPASDLVLNRFQFANDDTRVSVVDADGSVYEGTIQVVAANPVSGTNGAVRAEKEAAVAGAFRQKPAEDQASANVFFEVSGTNLSLGQKVVFTGNVLPAASNAVQVQNYFQNATRMRGGAQDAVQNQLPNQILLQNSQIRGRVQLPEGQAFDLEAVPTAP